jgi:hypothetical protein
MGCGCGQTVDEAEKHFKTIIENAPPAADVAPGSPAAFFDND